MREFQPKPLADAIAEAIAAAVKVLTTKGVDLFDGGIIDISIDHTVCPEDDRTEVCSVSIELVLRNDGNFVIESAHFERSHYVFDMDEQEDILEKEWIDEDPLT